MHQTRQETSAKIPIERKGTKYVARARSHIDSAVPLVIAVRDMLHLAKTAQEVREMIKQKALKINGRVVVSLNESLQLFHILHADKDYELVLSSSGKFMFHEHKKKGRLTKVISRRLVKGKKLQLNLHDGTNSIGKADIKIGDSLYLDQANKVISHVSLTKGSQVLIMTGSYTGQEGKITQHSKDKVHLTIDKKEVVLPITSVVAQ